MFNSSDIFSVKTIRVNNTEYEKVNIGKWNLNPMQEFINSSYLKLKTTFGYIFHHFHYNFLLRKVYVGDNLKILLVLRN